MKIKINLVYKGIEIIEKIEGDYKGCNGTGELYAQGPMIHGHRVTQ